MYSIAITTVEEVVMLFQAEIISGAKARAMLGFNEAENQKETERLGK